MIKKIDSDLVGNNEVQYFVRGRSYCKRKWEKSMKEGGREWGRDKN